MKRKDQKPNVKSNFVYFQIGLIVALLIAIVLIEHKTLDIEKEPQKVAYKADFVESSLNVKLPEDKPKPIEKVKKPSKKKPDPKTDEFKIDNKDLDDLFDTPKKPVKQPKSNKGEPNLEAPIDEPIEGPINHMRVEENPVFPGCEVYETNKERAACFTEQISKWVQRKFNNGLADDLGLSGLQRIYVSFTVDQKGDVVDVEAVSKVDALAQEAKRVTKLLPSMKPGNQQGKPVAVQYSLPIVFEIQ